MPSNYSKKLSAGAVAKIIQEIGTGDFTDADIKRENGITDRQLSHLKRTHLVGDAKAEFEAHEQKVVKAAEEYLALPADTETTAADIAEKNGVSWNSMYVIVRKLRRNMVPVVKTNYWSIPHYEDPLPDKGDGMFDFDRFCKLSGFKND